MKLPERPQVVKKCNLCFSCLGSGHRICQCKANRTWGKDRCSKRHKRFLQKDEEESKPWRQTSSNSETGESADAMLRAKSCSESLKIVAIYLSNGNTSIETIAVCNNGSTLSFADKDVRDKLNVPGIAPTLNNASIKGPKHCQARKWGLKYGLRTYRKLWCFMFTLQCISRTSQMITKTWNKTTAIGGFAR